MGVAPRDFYKSRVRRAHFGVFSSETTGLRERSESRAYPCAFPPLCVTATHWKASDLYNKSFRDNVLGILVAYTLAFGSYPRSNRKQVIWLVGIFKLLGKLGKFLIREKAAVRERLVASRISREKLIIDWGASRDALFGPFVPRYRHRPPVLGMGKRMNPPTYPAKTDIIFINKPN